MEEYKKVFQSFVVNDREYLFREPFILIITCEDEEFHTENKHMGLYISGFSLKEVILKFQETFDVLYRSYVEEEEDSLNKQGIILRLYLDDIVREVR